MFKITDKSPALIIALELLFPGATERIAQGQCVMCGQPINEKDFEDNTRKAFIDMGICHQCQQIKAKE